VNQLLAVALAVPSKTSYLQIDLANRKFFSRNGK
jgi:hypothetical protein